MISNPAMPPSQPYLKPRPPNVLAIDGGGVRGLSSLLILQQIMLRLQLAVGSKSALSPWQIFDVICGTSTGGLIAIMLGRLRMGVDDAIAHYRSLCKAVFGSPKWFGGLRNKLFGTAIYNSSTLEKKVKKIARGSYATHHNGEALLNETGVETSIGDCHTFVVAVRQVHGAAPPELFRSYAPEDRYKIWESARATTATAGFFDPMKIKLGTAPPITYLDGDLVANNPSELAFQQVRHLFPGWPIGCFLSLGTGLLNVVQFKGNLINLGIASRKLVKNCEEVADRMGERFRGESKENESPYFRFSVNRGLEDIKLDEWAQESTLAGVTSAYMLFQEQQAALEGCVKALKPRGEWIVSQREKKLL